MIHRGGGGGTSGSMRKVRSGSRAWGWKRSGMYRRYWVRTITAKIIKTTLHPEFTSISSGIMHLIFK